VLELKAGEILQFGAMKSGFPNEGLTEVALLKAVVW
jgi:hypothetical protein